MPRSESTGRWMIKLGAILICLAAVDSNVAPRLPWNSEDPIGFGRGPRPGSNPPRTLRDTPTLPDKRPNDYRLPPSASDAERLAKRGSWRDPAWAVLASQNSGQNHGGPRICRIGGGRIGWLSARMPVRMPPLRGALGRELRLQKGAVGAGMSQSDNSGRSAEEKKVTEKGRVEETREWLLSRMFPSSSGAGASTTLTS
jgi:hypothetical protein